MSRRGFLALIFGSIAAFFVAQLPGEVFAKKRVQEGYGSSAYGR